MKNSTIFDLIDINMVATEPLNRIWLNSSDHFGLLATFKKSNKGFKGGSTNEYKEEFSKIHHNTNEFRSIQRIVAYRIIATAIILISFLYLLLKILLK